MCDTMVATPAATADGVTIFAKNSNRQPNEAHHLLNVAATDHPSGSSVRCTYIEIPQVEHTYAVLLAKPFWMWGAEMGVNEHNVAIGNEAIFSKVPANKKPALIGMDLLRLGLERGATALEAVTVITSLLEKYGQGGNCGFNKQFYYHNSYLIADPAEAWVLETVDRHWAAKKINSVYTISNLITIGNEFDLASTNLVKYAVQKGWCRSEADFDFANCYSDFLLTTFGQGRFRRECSLQALSAKPGQVDIQSAARALRTHLPGENANWSPDRGIMRLTVCCHADLGPIRTDQTTGSMISYLKPSAPVHLLTATAAPCTSIFKPAWVDSVLPNTMPFPAGEYDPETLFWRHERLHRATLMDYKKRLALYQKQRDILEDKFIREARQISSLPASDRETFVANCFQESQRAEQEWEEIVRSASIEHGMSWHARSAWNKTNQKARLPDLQAALA